MRRVSSRCCQEIAALLHAAAVRDGPTPSAVVAVVGDITERRQADLASRRATIDAETSNRELEAFSSAVTHDLRGPLRSTHGFVGILLEDHALQLDETAHRVLARIVGAVERMSGLIDDLRALSHSTQARLLRQTVDLSALARGILTRRAGDLLHVEDGLQIGVEAARRAPVVAMPGAHRTDRRGRPGDCPPLGRAYRVAYPCPRPWSPRPPDS